MIVSDISTLGIKVKNVTANRLKQEEFLYIFLNNQVNSDIYVTAK